MLANANEKYYLCDSTKIGKVGFYKLAPLDGIDYFITDSNLSDEYVDEFVESGIEYINVGTNK